MGKLIGGERQMLARVGEGWGKGWGLMGVRELRRLQCSRPLIIIHQPREVE